MKKLLSILTVMMSFALITGCDNNNNGEETPENNPPMVTGVKATAKVGAIEISWTNPAEGTFSHVNIEYTDPKTGNAKMQKVNHPATSWELTGLTSEDGKVTFKVYTVSADGVNSKTSETVSATALDPDTPAPPMVQNVAAEGKAGSVEITWTNPTDGEFAKVVVEYTDPRDNTAKKGETAYPGTSWTLKNLLSTDGELSFKVYTAATDGTPSETHETVKATPLKSADEDVPPAGVLNAAGEAGEGTVKLTWEYPTEGSPVASVKISYTDPREGETKGQTITETVTSPTAEFTVSNLYKKYGEIEFSISTVSTAGLSCETEDIATVRKASLRVPARTEETTTEITLSTNNVTVTQVESSEGSLAALFDNNSATYYHSPWSSATEWPVNFDITLTEPVTFVKFFSRNRDRDQQQPGYVDIFGSNGDGEWTKIGSIAEGDIPGGRSAEYTSPKFGIEGKTFTMIRYSVLDGCMNQWDERNTNFTMADMKLYEITVEVIDEDED